MNIDSPAAGWSTLGRLMFRAGPLLSTVAMVAWAVGVATALGPTYDSPALWPLYILPFILLIWHILLCVGEAKKPIYLLYAFGHLIIFAIAWANCAVLIAGE